MNPFFLKKFLVGGVVLLSLGGLGCLAGCDGNPFLEKARQFTGLGLAQPGVVATVNGVPIYLRQVEALADMNMPSVASAVSLHGGSLESLWKDYADSLYQLVREELIRQELSRRGVVIGDNAVAKLEERLTASYKLPPGQSFDQLLEESNIQPDQWRAQLKARLELEALEAELKNTRTFSAEEVETWLSAHPDQRTLPESFEFILVESLDRKALEKQHKARQQDMDALRRAGMTVGRYTRGLDTIPEGWRDAMRAMQPGQISPSVRQTGVTYSYIVLLQRHPGRERTPVELYSLAESVLAREALPARHDQWLETAVAAADIRIARQFLPENVPVPAATPPVLLPWEQPSEPTEPESLGEVEGEE